MSNNATTTKSPWKAVGSPTRENNKNKQRQPATTISATGAAAAVSSSSTSTTPTTATTSADSHYIDHPAMGLGLDTSRSAQHSVVGNNNNRKVSSATNQNMKSAPILENSSIPPPSLGKILDDDDDLLPQAFSLWNASSGQHNGHLMGQGQTAYQLPLKDDSSSPVHLEDLTESAKQRSRSKSSSAAYGLSGANFEQVPLLSPDTIWAQNPQDVNNLIHRRSSTTPSYNPLWGASPTSANGTGSAGLNGAGSAHGGMTAPPGFMNMTATTMAPLSPGKLRSPGLNPLDAFGTSSAGHHHHHHLGAGEVSNMLPSPDALDRYRQQRRFSHAPQPFYNDINNFLSPDYSLQAVGPPGGRRHSLAGPLLHSPRLLVDAMDDLGLHGIDEGHEYTGGGPIYKNIDDYFENTEHRTRAWMEAGKNLQAQQNTSTWPLYVVEFKAGRRDFFYYIDDGSGTKIKKGDLVIVEADRGKDLGKVVHDNLKNETELKEYQATHPDVLQTDSTSRQVVPKRVFRLASPPEVSLLVQKSQDEVKAMTLCVQKIRQRKLTMEIVDAEYQWDRRKLTFYFVSERRIDFRELVKELFKIYKTRIWMCAVNANPLKLVTQPLQSAN